MRVIFDFDDSTFKMHAEGVNGLDQSQKIERSWSEAMLSLRDGGESMQIHFGTDGSMSVVDADSNGSITSSPFSEASKVVSEPEGKPEAEVWADTPVKEADVPDMGVAQPVPESGFVAMSHHADEMPGDSHES